MHKIKAGTLTAGTTKRNNAFSLMSSVKGTLEYWKQFLRDVLAMVRQLKIPTYFLTLSCAELRWEELPNIINTLNNLGPNEEKQKS